MKHYAISEQQLTMIANVLTDSRTIGPAGPIVQVIGMMQSLPEIQQAPAQAPKSPPSGQPQEPPQEPAQESQSSGDNGGQPRA